MANSETLQLVKRLTISALVADEMLMGILVLKGGNALGLAYDITNRASIDIDFSMENDFSDRERQRLQDIMTGLLNNEFSKVGLVAFDVKLSEKPQKLNDAVKSFWGGYLLEFKVILKSKLDGFKGDESSIRRNAIPLHPDQSTKFTVDISKHEYVADKQAKDIEGAIVFVYTPEMLALEKLRALCQQIPKYREVIFSMTSRSRARDFYDIYNIAKSFPIDFKLQSNIDLCNHIFAAKKVPLSYVAMLAEQREFHRQSWESVVGTVNPNETLNGFDFYFDYVIDLFKHLS